MAILSNIRLSFKTCCKDTTYFQKSKRKQVKIKHFQTKNTVFSDTYPNQNFYFAFHFQTKNTQSRCISKFHCLVTIYVWHLVSVSKYWYDDVIILGNDIAVGTNNL